MYLSQRAVAQAMIGARGSNADATQTGCLNYERNAMAPCPTGAGAIGATSEAGVFGMRSGAGNSADPIRSV